MQATEVGPVPSRSHVWVDGQWLYQRTVNKWTWNDGSWCVPPLGAVFYAKPAVKRFRKPVGRATRWNDIAQRYEEIDTGEDHWLWARGHWYVRRPDGVVVGTFEPGTCVERNE